MRGGHSHYTTQVGVGQTVSNKWGIGRSTYSVSTVGPSLLCPTVRRFLRRTDRTGQSRSFKTHTVTSSLIGQIHKRTLFPVVKDKLRVSLGILNFHYENLEIFYYNYFILIILILFNMYNLPQDNNIDVSSVNRGKPQMSPFSGRSLVIPHTEGRDGLLKLVNHQFLERGDQMNRSLGHFRGPFKSWQKGMSNVL